ARTDIPNSFRFGQSIADLADPLALEPQGLQGKRPAVAGAEPDTSGKHAIFLFDNKNIERVLETYAAYLVEVFSGDELRKGTFTAVGAVHRPGVDDNVPRYVGHYWTDYDHEIGLADPQPKTFVQYVMVGLRLSQTSGETHALIEKIAEAVIRLSRIANSDFRPNSRKRKHRYVLDLLDQTGEGKAIYIDLIRNLAVERTALTERDWNDKWKPVIKRIVEGVVEAQLTGNGVDEFLDWRESDEAEGTNAGLKHSDNFFRYPRENPSVSIRVGSIHSVKGETHTSTLVLDTFYRAHHLKTLKSWLLGKKSGGCGANRVLQTRLKLHYVAMTRPTHLLCLAMRDDAFLDEEIARLKTQRWRVARVTDAAPVWI
ncbi:MAG: UvrD-helicase domain-containing protein, partial [Nitrospiraceae bacterium]